MIDLEHSLLRWLLFFGALGILIAIKVYVKRRRRQTAEEARMANAAANDGSSVESDSDATH